MTLSVGDPYTVAATELFKAISSIAALVPEFGERRKKEIADETELLLKYEAQFSRAAMEFVAGSRSDELLGLADVVKRQESKIKNLIMIYAKELQEEKK